MLERMWRNRNTFTLLAKVKISSTIWKIVWRLLKDLEPEIPLDPAISSLGIYPKDYKLFYYKDTYVRMFIAALIRIAKTWSQPRCPSMTDWLKKIWYINTMEYYAAIRKSSCPLQGLRVNWKPSQQTNTGTEKQTHVLTHMWKLNNENTWTQGGEHHTSGPFRGWRTRRGRALGQIPNVCRT